MYRQVNLLCKFRNGHHTNRDSNRLHLFRYIRIFQCKFVQLLDAMDRIVIYTES